MTKLILIMTACLFSGCSHQKISEKRFVKRTPTADEVGELQSRFNDLKKKELEAERSENLKKQTEASKQDVASLIDSHRAIETDVIVPNLVKRLETLKLFNTKRIKSLKDLGAALGGEVQTRTWALNEGKIGWKEYTWYISSGSYYFNDVKTNKICRLQFVASDRSIASKEAALYGVVTNWFRIHYVPSPDPGQDGHERTDFIYKPIVESDLECK